MVSAASGRGTNGSNKGNEKVKIAATATAGGASHQPPTSTTPSTTVEPPGLGGRSGIRPDVNNLKRNLVQEAVRAYKSELLELLGTPSSVADKRIQIHADSSGGTSDNVVSNGGAGSDAASSAASSALYGNGSAPVMEYDEAKDGNKPVAYYKYGPGSALTGRTYAGEWATRDELIEDKLAALVQANPVSTTTDSNLLEGQWEFVFSSHRASDIVDPSRFVLIRTENGGRSNSDPSGKDKKRAAATTNNKNADAVGPVESRPWAIRSGRSQNPLRSLTRKIYLEELKDDEDPYVVDMMNYMGGLWSVQRRYDVTGLSRTAMDLGLKKKDLRAFGFRVPLKKQKKEKKGAYLGNAKVQVIYLDSDLCITTTEQGMDGPLLVYTKGNFWTARRKSRFLLATARWMWSKQSPLQVRQKVASALPFLRRSSSNSQQPDGLLPGGPPVYSDEENRVMLERTYSDKSRLTVLKMGEPLINPDGTLREDLTAAWDGESDPFVHLDPMERQELMKSMTIEAIEAAGKEQRDANKRKGKRYRQTPIDRSFKKLKKEPAERAFKKPQDKS